MISISPLNSSPYAELLTNLFIKFLAIYAFFLLNETIIYFSYFVLGFSFIGSWCQHFCIVPPENSFPYAITFGMVVFEKYSLTSSAQRTLMNSLPSISFPFAQWYSSLILSYIDLNFRTYGYVRQPFPAKLGTIGLFWKFGG